jgi:hypothetical protein
MKPDHVIFIILGLFLLAILVDTVHHRITRQRRKASSAAQVQAEKHDVPAEDLAEKQPVYKFAADENTQIKQALALSAAIRDMEDRFQIVLARFPEATRNDAIKRECDIVTEQLRITRSYEDELLRFVFSWRGRSSLSSNTYRPTIAQATWALTAANLTLDFASARIAALGG